MAKEFEHEMEGDFIDIDIPGNNAETANTSGQTEGASKNTEEKERPVKTLKKVVEDPLAEGEATEDIYSGRYKRDSSDRGIYTGGSNKERMMSRVNDLTESRVNRNRQQRRKSEKRKKTVLLVILLIAAVAAAAYMAGKYGLIGGKEPNDSAAESANAAESPSVTETSEPTAEETTPAAAEPTVVWQKDSNPQITELVNNYYTALSAVNIEQLTAILDPSVTINEEQIKTEGEFIEGYQDISTYVMDGMNAGEYAVYIAYSMKFKDIQTPAPGLIPAYVRPDTEGKLRLLRVGDLDKTLGDYMGSISNTDDIKALAAQVAEAYQQAQDADADLKAFISALESESVETAPAAETTPAETKAPETKAPETTQAAETKAPETKAPEFKDEDDIQYTTTEVKLRSKPTTEGEDYELLPRATWVHVIGVSDEWCKVVLKDGTSGYVYKKYLSPDKPEPLEAEEE